jgi:hypothetical protein
MKKLLFIPFLLLYSLLQGQDHIKKMKGGIKIGLGLSSLADIRKSDSASDISSRPYPVTIIGFRLTSRLANQWLLITDLTLQGKGGRRARTTGNYLYTGRNFSGSSTGLSTGFCPSLQLNFSYKTKPGDNSFVFGGGPFFDANNKNVVGIGFSSGFNLLTGYRFFPGFAIEFNFKKDLFYKKVTDEDQGPFYKNTTYGLCLAYEF